MSWKLIENISEQFFRKFWLIFFFLLTQTIDFVIYGVLLCESHLIL